LERSAPGNVVAEIPRIRAPTGCESGAMTTEVPHDGQYRCLQQVHQLVHHPPYCLTDEPTRTRNRCLTSESPRNRMKLPVPGFPRNDVGLVLLLGEDKVPQVPFILKDRIMEGDGIKMPVLTPGAPPLLPP